MTNSAIDLIIRIKNGYLAKKEMVVSPYSRLREEVLKKLVELKYIKNYQVSGELVKEITIELLYHHNKPALTEVKIFSKPGKRHYLPYRQLKPVLGGYGVSLLSTSKGILTNRQAYRIKIGGELLFNIW
jgi:small subunit ribosomal protein S8